VVAIVLSLKDRLIYKHINKEDKMYTLEQIIKVWKETYNEDMRKEYAGFISNLRRIKCVD
jgi:hypothetical protein